MLTAIKSEMFKIHNLVFVITYRLDISYTSHKLI